MRTDFSTNPNVSQIYLAFHSMPGDHIIAKFTTRPENMPLDKPYYSPVPPIMTHMSCIYRKKIKREIRRRLAGVIFYTQLF